jgi:hypothetical protein
MVGVPTCDVFDRGSPTDAMSASLKNQQLMEPAISSRPGRHPGEGSWSTREGMAQPMAEPDIARRK